MPRKRLRIVSDGTRHGTHVLGPNGEELHKLMSITDVRWSVENGIGVARFTVSFVEIEAEVQEAHFSGRVGDGD